MARLFEDLKSHFRRAPRGEKMVRRVGREGRKGRKDKPNCKISLVSRRLIYLKIFTVNLYLEIRELQSRSLELL